MPSACRDALSREISDPVHDPLTGVCYRNACAAEEAGAFSWEPGCAPTPTPIYGNYDSGGASGGGGGSYDGSGAGPGWRPWFPPGGAGGGVSPRRIGQPRLRSDGGLRSSPGGSSRTIVGGPQPGRTLLPGASIQNGGAQLVGGPTQAGGSTLTTAAPSGLRLIGGPSQDTTSTLATTGGWARLVDGPTQAGGNVLAIAQPGGYVYASPLPRAVTRAASPMQAYAQPLYQAMRSSVSGRMQVATRPSSAVTTRQAAPMQYAGRPSARGMGGLGQDLTSLASAAPWALGASVLPAIAIGLTRRKSRSWKIALLAGLSAAAIEGAAIGAYAEWSSRNGATTAA